ncbi:MULTISPECIES: hypothetical protein [unclassified Streptomyces]|uniref:hypothetical protein n=1 Tax=unclassified Streptomyces TaxID=2593676 RepID=UPI0033A43B61
MIGGRILDTSALTAAAQGSLYMQALLSLAHQRVIPLLVPTTALSDAYASLKPDAQQALHVIAQFPMLTLAPFTEEDARGAGTLRAARPEVRSDATAGHVAFLAAAREWPVISGDSIRLQALYPGIEVEPLP